MCFQWELFRIFCLIILLASILWCLSLKISLKSNIKSQIIIFLRKIWFFILFTMVKTKWSIFPKILKIILILIRISWINFEGWSHLRKNCIYKIYFQNWQQINKNACNWMQKCLFTYIYTIAFKILKKRRNKQIKNLFMFDYFKDKLFMKTSEIWIIYFSLNKKIYIFKMINNLILLNNSKN